MALHAQVLTLFPEMFPGPLGHSLPGKALARGTWALEARNIRDQAGDKHGTVDDAPFGGGPGMVMRPDVVDAAMAAAEAEAPAPPRRIHLSPRGRLLDQPLVEELAGEQALVLLCGRYEGVDERALEHRAIEEVSIGDYVLAGGELAAMVLLEAVVRLLPGVMGNAAGARADSFGEALLEHPHYTRPRSWQGRDVPEVLLSGDHAAVDRWRREQAEAVTRQRRPDLWRRYLGQEA